MDNLPPDWNNDRKLWDALGKAPAQQPPSNFAYLLRQKLAASPATVKRHGFSPFAWLKTSPFEGFALGLVAVTACVMLMIALTSQPISHSPSARAMMLVSVDPDFSQAAPHVELIQDLDVIEHLDEL